MWDTTAVRLNYILHFSVFDQVPEDWTITPGNVCERKTLKSKARPGQFYVADRHSDDYAFLGRMVRQQTDFVLRLPPQRGAGERFAATPTHRRRSRGRCGVRPHGRTRLPVSGRSVAGWWRYMHAKE